MMSSSPLISSSSHQHQYHGSSSFLSSDLEESSSRALQEEERQDDVIQEIWNMTGTFLRHADDTLSHLEEDTELLPQAILRKSQELADGVGWVARELEQQSPEQRAALAQACVDDYESTLALISENDDNNNNAKRTLFLQNSQENLSSSSPQTQEDFLRAIQGASTLLRDVESAFRDLTQDDAEDLADAGLTLARLFLLSLQNFYATLTPEDFIMMVPGSSSSTTHADRGGRVFIEELLDEDEENNNDVLHKDRSAAAAPTPLQKKTSKKTIQNQRVKVLWPRLGPQVQKALQWTQHEANQRPLLAVALGLTLWPAAFVTTLVGGSLVLADHVVQDVYQHFQEGPILSNLEQGAAQVVQVGKLGLVTTTILGKQTWRVIQRQVQRRGGVEQIVEDTKHMAVDRLTHPMESLGMAWKGVVWSVGALQETVQQVLQQQREEWQNEHPAVQEVSL